MSKIVKSKFDKWIYDVNAMIHGYITVLMVILYIKFSYIHLNISEIS